MTIRNAAITIYACYNQERRTSVYARPREECFLELAPHAWLQKRTRARFTRLDKMQFNTDRLTSSLLWQCDSCQATNKLLHGSAGRIAVMARMTSKHSGPCYACNNYIYIRTTQGPREPVWGRLRRVYYLETCIL